MSVNKRSNVGAIVDERQRFRRIVCRERGVAERQHLGDGVLANQRIVLDHQNCFAAAADVLGHRLGGSSLRLLAWRAADTF